MGFSQETLAERAGLHRTYIAGIEGGGRNITLKSIQKLAQALDIPVATLLAESDSAAPLQIPGVLLAEGNSKDLDTTLAAFRDARFLNPIEVVRDGKAALDFLFSNEDYEERRGMRAPHLMLLDMNLPKVRPMEVLRRIKADKQVRGIQVILLLSGRKDEDVGEAMRLGAAAWLSKPLDFQEFLKITARLKFAWAFFPPTAGPSPANA